MPTPPHILRCEPLEDRTAPAAAGDLDPTFGTGGRVVIPLDSSSASAMAVLPDGKIVLAGTARTAPGETTSRRSG